MERCHEELGRPGPQVRIKNALGCATNVATLKLQIKGRIAGVHRSDESGLYAMIVRMMSYHTVPTVQVSHRKRPD